MRKVLISLLALSFLWMSNNNLIINDQALAERPEPAYAKWGRLAMKTAKEKYPSAQILDYLHVGREKKQNTHIEKFKLWIKDGGKEFGLFIDIEFEPKTDRVIKISTRKSAT